MSLRLRWAKNQRMICFTNFFWYIFWAQWQQKYGCACTSHSLVSFAPSETALAILHVLSVVATIYILPYAFYTILYQCTVHVVVFILLLQLEIHTILPILRFLRSRTNKWMWSTQTAIILLSLCPDDVSKKFVPEANKKNQNFMILKSKRICLYNRHMSIWPLHFSNWPRTSNAYVQMKKKRLFSVKLHLKSVIYINASYDCNDTGYGNCLGQFVKFRGIRPRTDIEDLLW